MLNINQDINPKKIIVAGDSAGGNLALSLSLLCIKHGVRIPDGLYLAYPALNLNTKVFSPSLLLALDDQIVPYTFLKMCLESYLLDSNSKPDMDPFISPAVASDEVIHKEKNLFKHFFFFEKEFKHFFTQAFGKTPTDKTVLRNK